MKSWQASRQQRTPPLGGCACACMRSLLPSPPTTAHQIISPFVGKGCSWMQLAPVKAANLFRPAPQTDARTSGLCTAACSTLAPISRAAAYTLLPCSAASSRQARLGLDGNYSGNGPLGSARLGLLLQRSCPGITPGRAPRTHGLPKNSEKVVSVATLLELL